MTGPATAPPYGEAERVAPPRLMTADRDGARLRCAQTFNHFECCGLAGAIRPEDSEELPLPDIESNAVDGP